MLRYCFQQIGKVLRRQTNCHRASKLPCRLQVESLEDRQLLAANIQLTDAYLSTAKGDRLSQAAAGSVVSVQAEFKTQDLLDNAKYVVRFSIDGDSRTSNPISWGAGLASASWVARLGDWVVKPGSLPAGDAPDRDCGLLCHSGGVPGASPVSEGVPGLRR